MRPLKIKDRCIKISYCKCEEVVKTYDKVQAAYAKVLEDDEGIKSFACNVPLDGTEFTTDYVGIKTDGDYVVRECTYRNKLLLPRTAKLLDMSRVYWARRGVVDWAIVVESVQDEKT